ncbi:hypothetical protein MRX96_050249 [Rhipicephalus microplus]
MQGINRKIDDTDGKKQTDLPQYMRPVQNAYPTPGNVQGWSQNPFQVTSQSQWPASGAVYGPSKSGLQPPRGIGPQFTRSALQATTMQQKEANDKQYTNIDPALSPVGQPARSGHSSASFSFRGQHSHLGDGSCCDSMSSSTSSSGHCCICNAMSDSDLIPPRIRRRLAKGRGDKRQNKFSWTTYAPRGRSFLSVVMHSTLTVRRAQREFFYLPDTNMCYESNGVNVCTRGTNRFATLEHCVHSCVSTTHPAGKCFGKPMFTRCARRDVLSDWWYYDHSKCVPWSFPSGGCPANGSMVFATAKECERRCRDPHHGPRCAKPDLVACGRRHLKYPYFAHVSSEDGRMRCYRSSLATLRQHQCLVGENRFPNFGTCAVACRQKPPS